MANFSKLTPDERAQLEPETIKATLYPLADKGGNVRKLGKLVSEVISSHIIAIGASLAERHQSDQQRTQYEGSDINDELTTTSGS